MNKYRIWGSVGGFKFEYITESEEEDYINVYEKMSEFFDLDISTLAAQESDIYFERIM